MTRQEFERKHAWKRYHRRANPMTDEEREQIQRDNERANDPRLLQNPHLRRVMGWDKAARAGEDKHMRRMIRGR